MGDLFEKVFLFVLSFFGSRFKILLGLVALATISVVSIAGFRGDHTRNRPLYVFPDMDWQFKLRPQTKAGFHVWQNDMSSRPQVLGTVAQRDGFSDNTTWADSAVNTGKEGGQFVAVSPLNNTLDFVRRGQSRCGVYCQPCHGAQGDGNGITKKLGMTTVANLMDQRIIRMADGEVFNTISVGKSTMMGYAAQIPVEDRWAIVAYLRALQLSRLGLEADVPTPVLEKLKK